MLAMPMRIFAGYDEGGTKNHFGIRSRIICDMSFFVLGLKFHRPIVTVSGVTGTGQAKDNEGLKMAQHHKVTNALRFLQKNPRIPAKGIRYVGQKLQETEETPGQTQRYLKVAYQRLQRHPQMLKNIKRLSTAIGRNNT